MMDAIFSFATDAAAASLPVILGWVAVILRRIDGHLEKLEQHDRLLYGEPRVDASDGLAASVSEMEQEIDRLADQVQRVKNE